jgi:NAD(P)-dependent dehydrogenase (short-subunit alcohol dehydrogenase family)
MSHILISGANRGIGAALRTQYLETSASVIGTHRDQPSPGMMHLDVTDPASCAALARNYGDVPLDLLICNAGIYRDKGAALETGYPADDWAASFATNVTGVFLVVQALLPQLRASKGKIAIIGSQMGSTTKAKGDALIYRSSKAAVLNLGLNLATALKPDGVAVGVYHPGWVQTGMGGQTADIAAQDAAAGLRDCFAHLSLATTGCFENWDGRPHAL